MKFYILRYTLFIFFISSYSANAQDQSINIAVVSPKVKAMENKENIRAIIKSEIEKTIVGLSDYVTLVERDYLEQINFRRSKLQKGDNPNIASAAMTGANYLLESKVTEVKFDEGDKVVEKVIKTKETYRYVYWHKVNYTIDFELVNIETGEVAAQYKIKSDGLGFESLERKTPNHAGLIKKAITESRTCMRPVIEYMIMSSLLVKSRIIDIHKVKKDKAKKILVRGGEKSPFRGGIKFDIVKVYTQEIGGESIQRQEKIGEAKYKEKFYRFSECSVSKGEKDVLLAFNEGAELYCVPRGLKYMETCDRFLGNEKKRNNSKSFSAALKPTPKASEKKKASTKSKKKTKSTKKVKRKSGN